jgi:CheY-like chemotaxis protein
MRQPMRVLIADDYDDTREFIRLLLEFQGIDVVEARDGREAVERASSGNLDLILLDLEMPVMDGFTAVACLRKAAHLRHTPIIAISAHAGSPWVERARACGFTHYLSKPLHFESLAKLVSKYVVARPVA